MDFPWSTPDPAHRLLLVVYFVLWGIFAILGLRRSWLVWLYRRTRHRDFPRAEISPLPEITVQLPIYNERFVVRRLIRAVAALDYPRELLEIQVLDDSTDDTVHIVDEEVDRLRAEGVRIQHICRRDRLGYKAGALAHGMKTATGKLILIFDADFVPRPNFLREIIPYFATPRSRNDPGSMGPLERRVLASGEGPIDHPGRPFRDRARRAREERLLLQFQRNRGHVAKGVHRGRRRMGARHADRGSGPVLSRTAARLEVRVPARRDLPRGAPRRHGCIQGPAVPLGERIRAGREEDSPSHLELDSPAREEARSVGAPHPERGLRSRAAPLLVHLPRGPGALGPLARRRIAPRASVVLVRDGVGVRLLRRFAGRRGSRVEASGEVSPRAHVDRDRAFGEQYTRRAGRRVRKDVAVPSNAEARGRGARPCRSALRSTGRCPPEPPVSRFCSDLYFCGILAFTIRRGYVGAIPFVLLFLFGYLYVGASSMGLRIPRPRRSSS